MEVSDYSDINREFFDAPVVSSACRRILQDVCNACGAEEATVWIVSRDGRRLEGVVNRGRTPEIMEHTDVPVESSLVGMIASSGIGLCLGPDAQYNRSVDQKTGTSTRAMVATPLHLGDRLVGVLSVINPKDRATFQRNDLDQLAWRGYLLGLIIADLKAQATMGHLDHVDGS